MRMENRRAWWARPGCVGAACLLAGAAGAQSLFDSGAVGFTADHRPRAARTAYMESCASCHGPHLNDGQFAPAREGRRLQGALARSVAEALRTLIIKRMPPASPGSLGSRTYADIEAYLAAGKRRQAGSTSRACGRRARRRCASDGAAALCTMRCRAPSVRPSVTIRTPHYHAAMAARKALAG